MSLPSRSTLVDEAEFREGGGDSSGDSDDSDASDRHVDGDGGAEIDERRSNDESSNDETDNSTNGDENGSGAGVADGGDDKSELDSDDDKVEEEDELSSDDEARGKTGAIENMKVSDILAQKTPKEIFDEFDSDGSGEIDQEEFLRALPKMGIYISKARAIKYFRTMDLDRSEAIGFDELQAILIVCDPQNGNTCGFQPNACKTPYDAFAYTDVNKNGDLDEDEFSLALEYLDIRIAEGTIERMFRKYDLDNSGSIEYPEFRAIWLRFCDAKRQLKLRRYPLSRFATKPQMRRILDKILRQEEEQEAKAIAEAKIWYEWLHEIRRRRAALVRAKLRGHQELGQCLDTAGTVYIFGEGVNKQFGDSSTPAMPQHSFFAPACNCYENDKTACITPVFPDTLTNKNETDDMLNLYKFKDNNLERLPYIFKRRISSMKGEIPRRLNDNLAEEMDKIYSERLQFDSSSESSSSDSESSSENAGGAEDMVVNTEEAQGEPSKSIPPATLSLGGKNIFNLAWTPPLYGKQLKHETRKVMNKASYYYPDLDYRSKEEQHYQKNRYPSHPWMADLSGKYRRRSTRQKKTQQVWFRSKFRAKAFRDPTSPTKDQVIESIEDITEEIEDIDEELENENEGENVTEKEEDELKTQRVKLRKTLRQMKSRLRHYNDEEKKKNQIIVQKKSIPPQNIYGNYNCRVCSVGLWGREILEVSLSGDVAMAYSANGDIFAWGGKGTWWKNLQLQEKDEKTGGGGITPRSKVLKTVSAENKAMLTADQRQQFYEQNPLPNAGDQNVDRQQVAKTLADRAKKWRMRELATLKIKERLAEKKEKEKLYAKTHTTEDEKEDDLLNFEKVLQMTDSLSEEDKLADKMKVCLEYFGAMKRPPSHSTRLKYFENVLLPTLDFSKIRIALITRHLGDRIAGKSTKELLILLAENLIVAQQQVGIIESDEINVKMRKLEWKIAKLFNRVSVTFRRHKRIKWHIDKAKALWGPIYENFLSEESEREKNESEIEQHKMNREQEEYAMARAKRAHGEDGEPLFSADQEGDTIAIGGITTRGPVSRTPRGKRAALGMSCGHAHALLINTDARLYSWGTGTWGRLGHAYDAPIYDRSHFQDENKSPKKRRRKRDKRKKKPRNGSPMRKRLSLSPVKGSPARRLLNSPEKRTTADKLLVDSPVMQPVSPERRNKVELIPLPNTIPSPIKSPDKGALALSPVRRLPLSEIVPSPDPETARRLEKAVTPWTRISSETPRMEQKKRSVYIEQLSLDHKDIHHPKLVKSLKNFAILQCSAGYAHTGAVTDDGACYMWGASKSGQLGLGAMSDKEYGDQGYVAYPVQVLLPFRVAAVACGNLHTALATTTGKLFVSGDGSGGRLGLGDDFLRKTIYNFEQVRALDRHVITQVSCGTTHTVVATKVEGYKRTDMSFRDRQLNIRGGMVFVAGAAHAFAGTMHARFSEVHNLRKNPIVCISAGNSHTAAVSAGGELFTWGMNVNGGAAQKKEMRRIAFPKRVHCLYRCPQNLSEGCPARQLDPWADRGVAGNAVNGHRSGLGYRDECSLTMPRYQAWWEVDLQENCFIEEITVWNRNDIPEDRYKPRDYFMKRLFPCWIIVSEAKLPGGAGSLSAAISVSEEACRFDSGGRYFTWQLPINTVGRYVRIQLENTNSLHLAEVEVFGRVDYCSAPVYSVECGRDVTAVVCRPREGQDIEKAYLRAVAADRQNARFLRQLPRFQPYYDTFQSGHAYNESDEKCPLCTHARLCDLCEIRRRYHVLDNEERDPKTRRLRTLDELGTVLVCEPPPSRNADMPEQRKLRHCCSFLGDCTNKMRQKTLQGVEGRADVNLQERIKGV
jgi:alpha-tubulin suppressor-like RCC1 family protein/Ca2+-binding EF-hand superfamily protein